MLRRALAAALLAAPAAAALGQTPPTTPPVFPVGLDVVNVTVTVRDQRGHLVTDLEESDFVVREDGRPQAILVFGRAHDSGNDETMALDVGLLLDTSTSMTRELKRSQEAAIRFLDAIPRARDLLTIFFDHDIRISRYDSEHQQGLFERILEAKAGGDTALYDAIAVYISRVRDAPGRKVLVVFTDGEDSRSTLSLGELLQVVRSSAVTIYPIAFLEGFRRGSSHEVKARAFLNEIADLTGGQVFAPSHSRELPEVYQKILDELSGQYVLGFVSDRPAKDGRFRKLRVETARKGLRVRHRAGYYAGPEAGRDRGPGGR